MKHDVGSELGDETHDPCAVADICDPTGDLGLVCTKTFQDRMQSRFGMFDHQKTRCTEGNDALANFRADRAATAGDHDRLSGHEIFQPAVIDLHTWPQQQIFYCHGGQLNGGTIRLE